MATLPRIAVSSDGNANDPDDMLASAVTIALLAKSGNASKLVYYGHSDYIWTADPMREEKMRVSVVETAKLWGGFNLANIFNARAQTAAATAKLAAEINASTATDHLWIVAAGPMEVVGRGLAASDRTKHPYVHVISHSYWNDTTTVGGGYTWARLNAEFATVSYHHIKDQNVVGGINAAFTSYHWLRDSSDVKLRWLWSRSQPVNDAAHGCAEFSAFAGGSSVSVFDASDAGMTYWLIHDGYKNTVKNSTQSGDQSPTPAKLQTFFAAGNVTPLPLPVSPDGSTISAPTTASLQTANGTWTFGAAASAGNYVTHLNGQTNGGMATKLVVANGGKLYALNAANNWYVWNNGWAQTTNPGAPGPTPTPIPTPTPTPTPIPSGVEYHSPYHFGAKGNGIDDDTAAINAAVNATVGRAKGLVFFPPGKFKTSAPITFNEGGDGHSVIFQGVGDASEVAGNFAGYIFDRSDQNPTNGINVVRDLLITNYNANGGGVRMRGVVGTASVENCKIGGGIGLCLTNGNAWEVRNCRLIAGAQPGTVGIMCSNGATLINNDIVAFDQGIRHANAGLQVIGGRIEVCNIGIQLGQHDDGSTFQSSGFMLAGVSMESNLIGINMRSAFNGVLNGVFVTAHANTTRGQPQTGIDYAGSAGVATLGAICSGQFTRAGYATECFGGNTFISCSAANSIGPKWLLPSNPAKITQIQCS